MDELTRKAIRRVDKKYRNQISFVQELLTKKDEAYQELLDKCTSLQTTVKTLEEKIGKLMPK